MKMKYEIKKVASLSILHIYKKKNNTKKTIEKAKQFEDSHFFIVIFLVSQHASDKKWRKIVIVIVTASFTLSSSNCKGLCVSTEVRSVVFMAVIQWVHSPLSEYIFFFSVRLLLGGLRVGRKSWAMFSEGRERRLKK